MPAGTRKPDTTRAVAGLALVLFSVLVLAACAVGMPTRPKTVSLAIPEAVRSAIRPGVSTRADVLLLLADPHIRGERDSYFLYLADSYSGGIDSYIFSRVVLADYRCYIFAVQFDLRGTVSKSRMFEGRTREQMTTSAYIGPGECRSDGELRQTVQAWLDEP